MLYKSKKKAYNAYRNSPESFFEKYHRRFFNEKDLISPSWKWFETKYHYNLVENGIIDILIENDHKLTGCYVLDVGAGTGHWIDFYLHFLQAKKMVSIDFSKVAVGLLKKRYKKYSNVEILNMDISSYKKNFKKRFDVINAIGIMFHIVNDDSWYSAIENMCDYLRAGGIAIVGGDFGSRTEELGVMRKMRSLARWKTALRNAGGEILCVKRFNWFKGGVNEGLKNNLLAFRRSAAKI